MDRISPYRIATIEPERRSVAGVLAIERMIPDHMPATHTETSYRSPKSKSGTAIRAEIIRKVSA
jgi:hypothetical protein